MEEEKEEEEEEKEEEVEEVHLSCWKTWNLNRNGNLNRNRMLFNSDNIPSKLLLLLVCCFLLKTKSSSWSTGGRRRSSSSWWWKMSLGAKQQLPIWDNATMKLVHHLSALECKQDLVNSCNLSDWATTPLWLFINYRHSWAGHPVISCSRGMTPAGCRWNKAYMQSRRPVYILGMAAVRLSHSSSTATVWQKGSAASAETSSSLQKETDSPLTFCTGHF